MIRFSEFFFQFLAKLRNLDGIEPYFVDDRGSAKRTNIALDRLFGHVVNRLLPKEVDASLETAWIGLSIVGGYEDLKTCEI